MDFVFIAIARCCQMKDDDKRNQTSGIKIIIKIITAMHFSENKKKRKEKKVLKVTYSPSRWEWD